MARGGPRLNRRGRYTRVQQAGLRYADAVGAGYLAAARLLQESGNRERILMGLRTGNPQLILDSFDWSRWKNKLADGTRSPIISAFNAGGAAAETGTVIVVPHHPTSKSFSKQNHYGDMGASFDAKLPQAELAASLTAALAVTRVDYETMMALREVIVRSFRFNTSVFDSALQIERILRAGAGLDRRRARALQRFEEEMRKAGLADELLAVRVAQYRDRLLHDRAVTIARHETLSAINSGQEEMWRQAVQTGTLPATMNQIWIAGMDDRTCPICRSLNNVIVPMGHSFLCKFNGKSYERPQAHVQCRCTRGLTEQPPTD